jgi:hypothetical protein
VVTTTASIKERVLKMSALVDAQDESELLPPSNEEVNNWTQAYVTIMGALPDPAEEPTASQLAALAKRTLVHDCAPYTDFSVWTPFARRTIKNQKYRTVENPPGDEVGPAGSAWMLQEVEEALESTGAGMARLQHLHIHGGKREVL